MLGRHKAIMSALRGARQQCLNIAFNVEKVHRLPARCPVASMTCSANGTGQRAVLSQTLGAGNKALAALKNTYAALLTIEVMYRCGQQPGPKASAHHRHVG